MNQVPLRPNVVVYLAFGTWPPPNTGGAGSVGQLVASFLRDRGSQLVVLGEKAPVRVLVRTEVMSLEEFCSVASRPSTAAKRTRAKLNSMMLSSDTRRAAELGRRIADWRKARQLRETITRDSNGRMAVVFAYGSPTVALLNQTKPFPGILIHSEHSKGGALQEALAIKPGSEHLALHKRYRTRDANTARAADKIVFPSAGAAALFFEAHPELASFRKKVVVLHNGISDVHGSIVTKNEDQTSSLRSILNVAAHVPEKRVDLFIRGVRVFLSQLTPNERREYEGLNFGQQSALTQSLKGLATSDSEFRFLGTVPREELLAESSRSWACVTLPAVAVFDLIVLEWMSLGKPVIASPVGGNVEALGERYPLFASTDLEVAARLLELHNEPQLCKDIGEENQSRFVARFTLDRHVKNMSEILNACVEERILSSYDHFRK